MEGEEEKVLKGEQTDEDDREWEKMKEEEAKEQWEGVAEVVTLPEPDEGVVIRRNRDWDQGPLYTGIQGLRSVLRKEAAIQSSSPMSSRDPSPAES